MSRAVLLLAACLVAAAATSPVQGFALLSQVKSEPAKMDPKMDHAKMGQGKDKVDPAAIEQGKKVYTANKCQICHSIDEVGNKKGPLDGVGKKLSAEEIRAWMVDAEGMTKKTKAPRKPLMKSYPKMEKADLDALVAYMQSLK